MSFKSSYVLQQIEFQSGEWPPALVPLSIEASGLTGGPLLCNEEQRYALEGVQVDLPFSCRTKVPHNAEPTLDIINGDCFIQTDVGNANLS